MIKVEFYDYTRLFFGFAGIGLQVLDLHFAIFAYFDQYLVRFFLQEIRFVKNIGCYYDDIHFPLMSVLR